MPTAASSDRYFPGQGYKPTKTRLERFQDMNTWITARGGWITSLPGAATVEIDILPESFLLTELSDAGYEIKPTGRRQRILPVAIVQRFRAFEDGTLQAISSNSTAPCAMTVTHAGVSHVDCYEFKF